MAAIKHETIPQLAVRALAQVFTMKDESNAGIGKEFTKNLKTS